VATTLTEACTIRDDAGGYYDDTFDPSTGKLTPNATTTIYSGPCQVRPLGLGPRREPVETRAGAEVVQIVYRVTVPWDGTSGVRSGMGLTIDASTDASLVGIVMVIERIAGGDWQPSRRLDCEERVSGFRQR
jgi:hypothetical protein